MASFTEDMRSSDATTATLANTGMKIEVMIVPVSDVDRAKEFYLKLGWRLDAVTRKQLGLPSLRAVS